MHVRTHAGFIGTADVRQLANFPQLLHLPGSALSAVENRDISESPKQKLHKACCTSGSNPTAASANATGSFMRSARTTPCTLSSEICSPIKACKPPDGPDQMPLNASFLRRALPTQLPALAHIGWCLTIQCW